MLRRRSEMSDEEWLQWRRSGIGGSDAPSIMKSEGAFGSPYSVWEDKVHGKTKKSNKAMKDGNDREPVIREWFEAERNEMFMPMLSMHDEHSWILCSLDGIDPSGEVAIEIKNAGEKDHSTALKGDVPEKYQVQIQHQYLATRSLKMIYYISCPANGSPSDSVVIPVYKNEDYIKKELFPELEKFWRLVQEKTPPEPPFLDMEGDAAFEIMIKLAREIKEKENRLKEIKQQVQDRAGGKDCQWGEIKFKKIPKEGCIDYKTMLEDYLSNLRSHYPDIDFPPMPYEAYTKKSSFYWRLYGI